MAHRSIARIAKDVLNVFRYLRVLEPVRSALFSFGYRFTATPEAAALWFRILRPDLVRRPAEVDVVDLDGLVFECRPNEYLDSVLIRHRVWEPHTRVAMKQILRPGDVFFDVGAHVGTETIFGSRLVGANGRVISIEPAPWLLPRLVRHIQRNASSNVTVLNVAAGAAPGVASLRRAAGNDGQSRIGSLAGTVNGVAPCQVVALDDVWRALGRPDVRLIKIDVEGHEGPVLRGSSELLERVPHLLFETLWDVDERADASRALLEDLVRAGWTIRHWDGTDWMSGLPAGRVECDVWATRESTALR